MQQTLGGRLKWLREFKELSLREFADRIGADPGYLSKIENGKALNVSRRFIGRIAFTFRVRVDWLDKGDGDPFITGESHKGTQRELTGWSEKRIQRVFAILDELPEALGAAEIFSTIFKGYTLEEFQECWHKTMEETYGSLPKTARLFWNDVYLKVQLAIQEAEFQRKLDLTVKESSDKSSDVKLRMPELVERLRKATAASGKKTELAAFLKRVTKREVPLASVSRWLSGEREPGGEVALQLDAWAEGQGFPRTK